MTSDRWTTRDTAVISMRPTVKIFPIPRIVLSVKCTPPTPMYIRELVEQYDGTRKRNARLCLSTIINTINNGDGDDDYEVRVISADLQKARATMVVAYTIHHVELSQRR